MPDVVRALAISAGILLLVVVLIVIITIAVVNRGEGEHVQTAVVETPVKEAAVTTPPPPAKATKPAAPATEDVSVLEILLYGVGLFVLTVLGLVALSLVEHLAG
jgi:hypothetical protein